MAYFLKLCPVLASAGDCVIATQEAIRLTRLFRKAVRKDTRNYRSKSRPLGTITSSTEIPPAVANEVTLLSQTPLIMHKRVGCVHTLALDLSPPAQKLSTLVPG